MRARQLARFLHRNRAGIAMEVILREQSTNLGKRGEIVKVPTAMPATLCLVAGAAATPATGSRRERAQDHGSREAERGQAAAMPRGSRRSTSRLPRVGETISVRRSPGRLGEVRKAKASTSISGSDLPERSVIGDHGVTPSCKRVNHPAQGNVVTRHGAGIMKAGPAGLHWCRVGSGCWSSPRTRRTTTTAARLR